MRRVAHFQGEHDRAEMIYQQIVTLIVQQPIPVQHTGRVEYARVRNAAERAAMHGIRTSSITTLLPQRNFDAI
eukprot:6490296-Amphidinium_carterae.1